MSAPLSDLGLDPVPDRQRNPRRRNGLGCLAVLVALVVLLGGAYVVGRAGFSALDSRLNPPADYPGSGSGSVIVEVKQGDAASDIAATLAARGVVKSEEAFVEAAANEPRSRGIQVGFYRMRRQMSAQSALDILLNPANLVQTSVTIPEGWTVRRIVARLAQRTDLPAKQYAKALRRPAAIGLPPYARGNPEGYLFPATYPIPPDATAKSILSRMVDRYRQAAAKLKLRARAAALGVSAHDAMTVASLVQAEARFDKDFPKVSRVIYNRLRKSMPLQFDSTVQYAVGRDGSVGTTPQERRVDSPYNTYRNTGLPPSPITAPGEQAIQAALNPADGSWLYFVTTNPDTGVTKFATTYRQHLRNKAKFDAWCAKAEHC